jgi:hypothetical protein
LQWRSVYWVVDTNADGRADRDTFVLLFNPEL